MSLEALIALLEEEPPPIGAMPQLGISCLRLAGRALVPHNREGNRPAERTAKRLAGNRLGTRLKRLPAIQVFKMCF